jgi:hypothetical protein
MIGDPYRDVSSAKERGRMTIRKGTIGDPHRRFDHHSHAPSPTPAETLIPVAKSARLSAVIDMRGEYGSLPVKPTSVW